MIRVKPIFKNGLAKNLNDGVPLRIEAFFNITKGKPDKQ